LADPIRTLIVSVSGASVRVIGVCLAVYPLLITMFMGWHAATTPENVLTGLGVGDVVAVGTLLFVMMWALPGVLSWMRARANAALVLPEKIQLGATVNLWHATGGNQGIQAAMSLVHLLEEMRQGNVAQRVVEHLVALQRRGELFQDAASLDVEQTRPVVV
jgi:hypothetical protein